MPYVFFAALQNLQKTIFAKTLGKKKKFKEGQAEQVLDDLFFEAIKGVERLKPKVVIFENVMGFATNIISHTKEKCPMSFLRHTKIF
jgi:site-specific DNA-cytosine methylase